MRLKDKYFHPLYYIKLFIYLLLFSLLIAVPTLLSYMHEEFQTVTVISTNEQQHLWDNGDGIDTKYYYLVNTDKGVYEISPSGIYHSNAFGTLQPGKSYTIHTRGYNVPLFNIYPHIINATEQ